MGYKPWGEAYRLTRAQCGMEEDNDPSVPNDSDLHIQVPNGKHSHQRRTRLVFGLMVYILCCLTGVYPDRVFLLRKLYHCENQSNKSSLIIQFIMTSVNFWMIKVSIVCHFRCEFWLYMLDSNHASLLFPRSCDSAMPEEWGDTCSEPLPEDPNQGHPGNRRRQAQRSRPETISGLGSPKDFRFTVLVLFFCNCHCLLLSPLAFDTSPCDKVMKSEPRGGGLGPHRSLMTSGAGLMLWGDVGWDYRPLPDAEMAVCCHEKQQEWFVILYARLPQ